MLGGAKKDNDSELLKLTCCGKRSLVLVGQGGNWLKVNTGRDQRGWVHFQIRKSRGERRAVVWREYREI